MSGLTSPSKTILARVLKLGQLIGDEMSRLPD